MAFDGTEGDPIDPIKAGEWTRRYREINPGKVQGYFFGRDVLLALLAQPETKGIRFYYGLNDQTPQLVAVGANGLQNDQLGKAFIVADDARPCPPYTSERNLLNS